MDSLTHIMPGGGKIVLFFYFPESEFVLVSGIIEFVWGEVHVHKTRIFVRNNLNFKGI